MLILAAWKSFDCSTEVVTKCIQPYQNTSVCRKLVCNPKWEIFTKSQEEMKGLTLILSSLEIKFNSTGGLKNLCSWKSASWSETPVYLDVAAVVKRLCCFVAHLRDTIKSTKNGTRKPYLNSFSRKGNQCMHGFILYKQISWKFRI